MNVDPDVRADYRFDLAHGDATWAIDDDFVIEDFDDGGFEADCRRASVEDGVDAGVQVVEDVLCGGRTGVPEGVGAGGGDGQAGGSEKSLRDRVRGDADAHKRPTGGYGVWDGGGPG